MAPFAPAVWNCHNGIAGAPVGMLWCHHTVPSSLLSHQLLTAPWHSCLVMARSNAMKPCRSPNKLWHQPSCWQHYHWCLWIVGFEAGVISTTCLALLQ